MSVSYESLRAVPLLQSINDKDLRRLAGNLRERRSPAGSTIVAQGEGAVAFFIILEGDAVVTVGDQERARLKAGDYIGELALLDPEGPRTATVTATSDVVLAALSSWEFKPFVLEHPEVAWELLQTLARRQRVAQLDLTGAEPVTPPPPPAAEAAEAG
ncbi:MAG TPA: cyclic nucleotide-binding domain-containing protein [Solirubrobacteraceae bacterium]|nr:cyclic nucleotide-binding domain-containing protein [Solirubrobacteraceae bacterium]